MMAISTRTALSLFNTLDNIATPFSVKANGIAPPKYFFEGITFCDTKDNLLTSDIYYFIRNQRKSHFCYLFIFHPVTY